MANNRLNGQDKGTAKNLIFYEGEFKAAKFDGVGFLRQENKDFIMVNSLMH